jgi:hypothetical protein
VRSASLKMGATGPGCTRADRPVTSSPMLRAGRPSGALSWTRTVDPLLNMEGVISASRPSFDGVVLVENELRSVGEDVGGGRVEDRQWLNHAPWDVRE